MSNEAAFRSEGARFPRFFGRGAASERGGVDRLARRIDGGPERPRGERTSALSWPVSPPRREVETPMVAPPSTIPAVVASHRATTAAPFADDAAPPILIDDEARCPVPVEIRRGGLGLVAAIGLHLFGLAALLAMPTEVPAGGGEATEAIEVAMFSAEDEVDQIAATAAPAPTPAETEPVATEAPPVPEPDPAPIETATLEPPPVETVTIAEPPPPEPPPVVVAEPPPVEPPVLATTAAAEEAAPPPPPAKATPAKVAPKPEPRRPRRDEAPKKTLRAAAETTRAVAEAAHSAARNAVSGARAAGEEAAAGAGVVADWRASVMAALARAKRYPDGARDRGVEGRAVVTFTLSRDGTVGSVRLARSSGVAALDAETLAMPLRARFPAMPPGGPAVQSFTAGVRYDLR